MAAPILVTGGTGTLGRLLIPHLQDAGNAVRVLSRHHHDAADGIEFVTGDLTTGTGVDAAVAGAEVIVHCAGSASGDAVKTQNLVDAAVRAGARHLVVISVVGADRMPVGYFRSKLAVERIVAASGVPWTALRASQFYDLVLLVARQMAKLPVIPVPSVARFQPVDAAEVAARLAELALGEPAGLVPDIAGPRIYGMAELIRGYLRAVGKRRPILQFGLPGKAGRAFRAGGNLAPERAAGGRTWEEFLAERVGDTSRHL